MINPELLIVIPEARSEALQCFTVIHPLLNLIEEAGVELSRMCQHLSRRCYWALTVDSLMCFARASALHGASASGSQSNTGNVSTICLRGCMS